MSKNRTPSGLVHKADGIIHKLSKERATGKFFIRGTNIEVPPDKIRRPENKGIRHRKENYDFSKPSQAQDLGDEWDHYAWSADDY